MDKKNILNAKFYGYEVSYEDATTIMADLHEKVVQDCAQQYLMLLEHKPVITYTSSNLFKSFKSSKEQILSSGIDVKKASRGGDVTFHGAGQLVGYPILAVKPFAHVDFIRTLENALLKSCHELGIKGALLLKGFSGIWVKERAKSQKIELKKMIAIGVGIANGVSKHGFALNIGIDYKKYSEHITPCGLKDKGVFNMSDYFVQNKIEMPGYLTIVETFAWQIAKGFDLKIVTNFLGV